MRKLLMCRIPFLVTLGTLASAVLLVGVAHAQVYKWVDDKGVVNYSSTPPPKGKGVVKLDEDNSRVTTIPAPEVRRDDPAAAADPALRRRVDQLEREAAAQRQSAGQQEAASAEAYRRWVEQCRAERRVDCDDPSRGAYVDPRYDYAYPPGYARPRPLPAPAPGTYPSDAGHRAGWRRRSRAVLPAAARRRRGGKRQLRHRRRVQPGAARRRDRRTRSRRRRRAVRAGARVGGAATPTGPTTASDATAAVAATPPRRKRRLPAPFRFVREPGQRGSSEDPIRNSSTARAHCRPSRIAQTTSDWPRRRSPAANTFGTEVA